MLPLISLHVEGGHTPWFGSPLFLDQIVLQPNPTFALYPVQFYVTVVRFTQMDLPPTYLITGLNCAYHHTIWYLSTPPNNNIHHITRLKSSKADLAETLYFSIDVYKLFAAFKRKYHLIISIFYMLKVSNTMFTSKIYHAVCRMEASD